MAETKFLGFQQVSQAYYNELTDEQKKGYLWFVREVEKPDGGDPIYGHKSIYFGTRLYAEINETDATLTEKVNSIVESLGEMVDENGDFQGFLPTSAHTILGADGVSDVTTALEALEAAILENKVDISGKVDKVLEGANGTARIFNETDGGGAKFEHKDGSEAFVGVNDGGENGLMAQIYADKLNGDGKWQGAKIDVTNGGIYYTVGDKSFAERAVEGNEIAVKGDIAKVKSELESEISQKVAGLFHFKGVVATVEELPTEGVEEGDVYQVTGTESGETDIEYAYVNKGTEEDPEMVWVELGAVHDLSAYATKEEVNDLADLFEGELNGLDGRVDNLEAKQTLSAETYTEAAAAISGLTPGQIIYITTDEEGESGHTAGPYIVTESGGLKELKKLESSSGTGETPIDRIENLENTVGIGDKSDLGGKTIIEKIVECDSLHQIKGDDVEE